jgi:hypothetical protein
MVLPVYLDLAGLHRMYSGVGRVHSLKRGFVEYVLGDLTYSASPSFPQCSWNHCSDNSRNFALRGEPGGRV